MTEDLVACGEEPIARIDWDGPTIHANGAAREMLDRGLTPNEAVALLGAEFVDYLKTLIESRHLVVTPVRPLSGTNPKPSQVVPPEEENK